MKHYIITIKYQGQTVLKQTFWEKLLRKPVKCRDCEQRKTFRSSLTDKEAEEIQSGIIKTEILSRFGIGFDLKRIGCVMELEPCGIENTQWKGR